MSTAHRIYKLNAGYNGKLPKRAITLTRVVWERMHSRCTDTTHPMWPHFGGKGIKVCRRWLHFSRFVADMGARPGMRTLMRLDVDRDYKPSNCLWSMIIEVDHGNRKR